MKIALIKLILFLVFVSNAFAGTIKLPQTGQATCYTSAGDVKACAGTMQDGNIKAGVAWPNPRFSVGTGTTASCVADALTGLSWTKNGNYPDYTYWTWEEALAYIAALNSDAGLCGYKDWRMPNINEMDTLLNSEKTDIAAWLEVQGFSGVMTIKYWTSTTYASNTDNVWVIDIWNSTAGKNLKADVYKVWPVRAGQANITDTNYPANIWKTGQTTSYKKGDDGDLQRGVSWPDQRFKDNQDGTVTDNLTGLMWLKDADCFSGVAWEDTFGRVKDFNVNHANYGCSGYKAAYNDWRLPNKKEFAGLLNYSFSNPPLQINPPQPFINIHSPYWSATTFASKPASAWILDMVNGNINPEAKSYSNHIWPVRSGVADVNTNCTATLSSSLHMNIPAIVFGELLYAVELEYSSSTDGNIWFKVIRAEQLKDTTPYDSCQAAVLLTNYKLAIPALNYDNVSYQANLEYVQGADSNIMFKLTSAQQN